MAARAVDLGQPFVVTEPDLVDRLTEVQTESIEAAFSVKMAGASISSPFWAMARDDLLPEN